MCSGRAGNLATTGSTVWSPAVLAAEVVESSRNHPRHRWPQAHRAHSASSSAPRDGPSPAPAGSPAAALSPAGQLPPIRLHTGRKRSRSSGRTFYACATTWLMGTTLVSGFNQGKQVHLETPKLHKHTNLSLHFLFLQFHERQPREVHGT